MARLRRVLGAGLLYFASHFSLRRHVTPAAAAAVASRGEWAAKRGVHGAGPPPS